MAEQGSAWILRTRPPVRMLDKMDLWCWRRRPTARARCERQKKTLKFTWCMTEAEFVRPLLSDRGKLMEAMGKVRARGRKLEAAHGVCCRSLGPTLPPSLHLWAPLLLPRPVGWRGTPRTSRRQLMLREASSQ